MVTHWANRIGCFLWSPILLLTALLNDGWAGVREQMCLCAKIIWTGETE